MNPIPQEHTSMKSQIEIRDVNELVVALARLPVENHLAFATTHQDKIQNGDQLAAILSSTQQLVKALSHALNTTLTSLSEFDEIISTIKKLHAEYEYAKKVLTEPASREHYSPPVLRG